ncbi:hypothetical protein QBC38DRAFT_439950 [Podospora fimiseda]|uniref:Uncharacterized protein n=1 Tax=Podospora fimiseda TaxID=252190 RepID=A0AAN7BXN8_9PEZI|nr:hypothetical protein QBC38DRAFT_439950 [Podospora fimiseda]
MQLSLYLHLLVLTQLVTSIPTPVPALTALHLDSQDDNSNKDNNDALTNPEFSAISTAIVTTSCFSSSHKTWSSYISKVKDIIDDACLSLTKTNYRVGEEKSACFGLEDHYSDDDEKKVVVVEFKVKLDAMTKERRLEEMECRYNFWKGVDGCERGGRRREGGWEYWVGIVEGKEEEREGSYVV